MESKKINQLATNVAPQTSDLTIIGDPVTGVSKKITLLQIANLFATTGTVSSVAVTETGDALTITGSPITSAGTINIGFAGDATQYVRGDGALADFPTSTGGGSSVSYYLNSSVSQGTIGGVAYRELSKEPVSGAGTDITASTNGYIASYITDANDPSLLEVPGGNFNCEFYFSVNSNNHDPYVYAELYKYDGSTFTLLGSSQSVPEYLSNGTTLSPYYFAIPVATAVLSVTDRLAIRIYVNVDGRVVTLHTENNHLCQVVTTFSKGLTSLNNLTRQVQFLATGTSGTDFAISSSTATHTFNLPVASATNTGKLSSTDWSTFNGKVPYTGATANVDLGNFNFDANNISGGAIIAKLNGPASSPFVLKSGSSGYTIGDDAISLISSPNVANTLILASNIGVVTKTALIGLGSLTANRTFTLPDASGTLALTSNLSSYVPYTGATTNVDLGDYSIKVNGILAYGASGSGGLIAFRQTGTLVGAATGSAYIGSVSAGKLNIYFGDAGLEAAILDNSLLTADRTYNLPNANGTIALTSDLSSYLPLTGGTLTGALNGTTATFGGNLNITINTSGDINYLALNDLSWNIGDRKSISWYQSATKLSSIDAYFEAGLNVGFRFSTYLNANFLQDAFTLSSAGAGVFSSTLIANNNISAIRSGSSLTTLGQSRYLNLNDYVGNSNARMEIGFGYSAATGVTNVPAIIGFLQTAASALTKGDLYFATRDVTSDTAPTVRLTIASSGEATFTGALSGTSATFSGNMAIGGTTITDANMLNVIGNQSTVNIGLVLNNTNSTHARIYALQNVNGNFNIRDYTASSDRLSISSTGAATFSSSVTASGAFISSMGNSTQIFLSNSATTGYQYATISNTGANLNFGIERSTGGALSNGSLAYASLIQTSNSTALQFGTNNNIRATIDSSGNVGIGTSSPSYTLDITGGGRYLKNNEALRLQSVDSNGNYIAFLFGTSAFAYIGSNYHLATGSPSANDLGIRGENNLIFLTGGATERMRITTGDDVYVTRNADASRFGILNTKSGGNNWYLNSYSNGSLYMQINTSNLGVFDGTTGVYTALSDINKKKDFEQSTIGLNAIMSLKPTLYRMKSDETNGNKELGFIAQEVKEFIPQAFVESEDFIGLNYNAIVAALVKSVQELKAEIDELKNK